MTNKSSFGTGDLINTKCAVVRATAELNVTFPPDTTIKNNVNRLGYIFSYGQPTGLSSNYIWLGDFGETSNFKPNSVELKKAGTNEFTYIRETPFEFDFAKGIPITTLKTVVDSINVKRPGDTVIISPKGRPIFSSNLAFIWGFDHDVTGVPGGNNYCSRELVNDDGSFSPSSFKGKLSNDDPDGQIGDNPENPNNRSRRPGGLGNDDDEEEENRIKLQFIKVAISRFRVEPDGTYNKNDTVKGFQKFSNIDYAYATGFHDYILIPIENAPEELFYRHGISFLSVLFFDTVQVVFVGRVRINFRYDGCIAAIEQLDDFDSKIKKSLSESIQLNVIKYFISKKERNTIASRKNLDKETGLEKEIQEPKYIHKSNESVKPSAKIWSYSYYENLERVARDI